ncbi:hypothetical protein ACWEN3_18785 [Streptomyces sp. NPDC004561]
MGTAMILIVAMTVAAGATVWTSKGNGDQPTMVGLVLASTLLSPITAPLVIQLLAPLLSGGYADSFAASVHTTGGGFAFVGVVLPCATGILVRLAQSTPLLGRALTTVVPAALVGSLVTTYVNASGALGSFVAQPRPLLLGDAPAVAIQGPPGCACVHGRDPGQGFSEARTRACSSSSVTAAMSVDRSRMVAFPLMSAG